MGGGGTLVYQAGYYPRKRTFKKHPKHVFSRYENRPYKYVFLHALFLICLPCPFQNLSIWPKSHPFIFRYENRPYKYVFLQAFFFFFFFFLICPPCPFQNLSIWPKTHPFPQFCTFFALLNDVRAYIVWSWKTTLITFFRGRYPTSNASAPPPRLRK